MIVAAPALYFMRHNKYSGTIPSTPVDANADHGTAGGPKGPVIDVRRGEPAAHGWLAAGGRLDGAAVTARRRGYGGSCHKRPGSWEANRPFELQAYLSEGCHADKWF
jgi:hypothetical protein